ncbi:hypothetical protein [Alkalihalobacillus sp. TS-13]|uniref:hypothetical protein n=1 Tax=Alkalihalobacillus sp. TS-13 TaxID=2842455 RepID=UPI001C873EDC|nr:hypothetical protein [Alkalihalobacillus sp. TS-13]
MSLKLIELQIAIPRTQDAGKVQEKLQQQSQINQSHAAAIEKERSERNRTSVEKQDRTDKQQFDDRNRSNAQHHQQNRQTHDQEKENVKHPYKGQRIDFSG